MSSFKYDHRFLIFFVGCEQTGKTAMLRALKEGSKGHIKSSIGIVDEIKFFYIKGRRIMVTLFDVVGQERYREIPDSYFKNNDGIIFFYSVKQGYSAKFILESAKSIESRIKREFVKILVGNGCVCAPEERKVSYEEEKQLIEELKFKFFKVSTEHDINTKEALSYIIKELYKTIVSKIPKENLSMKDYKEMNKRDETCCIS